MSLSPGSKMDVEVVQEDTHSSPLSEHNYSKSSEEAPPHEEGEEEMMDTGGCPSLTSLDENQDTFETFLLCLLHTFTRNQQEEEDTGSRVELNVSLGSGVMEISPEALNSLSPEQVQTLLTSNSVNYDAVQQIMAQRQHQHQRGRTDPQGELQEPSSSSSSDTAAQNGSLLLQQILGMQFTQEQLKQIQIQVNELLRSQHVSLPPDLTPEQQQQLIQTLIWKQIHMQGPLQRQGNGGQGSTVVGLLKKEEAGTLTPSQTSSQAPPMTEGTSPQKSVQSQVSTSQQTESPQQPLQSTSVLGTSVTPAPTVLNPVIVPSTAFRSSLAKPTPAPLPKSTPPPLTSPTAVTPTLTSPSATQSPAPSISSPVTIIPSGPTVVTRRRKDATKTRKEEPKKPPLPYNLFFSEVYSTVHAANPQMNFADSSRIISMMWNAMGRDTKKRYYDEHERLKEEYRIAMEKYKEETKPVELTTVARAEKPEGEVQIETELNPEPFSEAAEKQNTTSTSLDTSVLVKPEPKDPNLCVNEGCINAAVFAEERGPGYCSNDCVAKHCRNVFQTWVAERKVKA